MAMVNNIDIKKVQLAIQNPKSDAKESDTTDTTNNMERIYGNAMGRDSTQCVVMWGNSTTRRILFGHCC